MELLEYIESISLNKKSEKERALYLCFYHYKETGENSFSMSFISKLFENCGYTVPNLSRLKNNLITGRNRMFLRTKNSSLIEFVPVVLQELERSIGGMWEDNITVDSNSELLDEEKFCNKRQYLDKLIHQINHCYSNNCYDATAVLMRRLLEILLIQAYIELGIDGEIKNSDDNGYKMLDGIVKNAVSNSTLALSRIKNELNTIRKVGNFSAHGLTYTASKKDIDDIKLNYRVLIEELYNKARLL